MNRVVNWITASDTHLFHLVNQHLRCRVFDFFLPKITHIGGATCSISSLLVIITMVENDVRSWAFQALISLAFSHVIVYFIKKFYCRKRPYDRLKNVNLYSNPLKDFSFPSGHTTAAFSIAVVFSLHSILLAFLLLPIAFLVGVSRMYLGLHYPTDCLIGALIGTISSVFVFYLI